jgi:hypothetical protein
LYLVVDFKEFIIKLSFKVGFENYIKTPLKDLLYYRNCV